MSRMNFGAQLLKEKGLLCESMFIPIEKKTLTLKMVKKMFFLWNQNFNSIYPKEENMFIVPNLEKKGDYYVNPCLSKSTNEH